MKIHPFAARGGILLWLLLLAACRPATDPAKSSSQPARFKVTIQTDWAAQAEHGGFYQALASGAYERAGLDVEIAEGGQGIALVASVATNRIAFGITRSEEILKAAVENVPLIIVCAYLQHDPQAILFHEENPISTFKDLDGKTIMSVPGAYWISYAEAAYGIKLNVMPMNGSLAAFLSDKKFIQQCFVTNEPFYARRAGAKIKTLLLSESGYDPYRVVFTNAKFAHQHPEVVRAFVAASIAGWEEYITGDPSPGNRAILARNPGMSQELLDYSREQMLKLHIVLGDPAKGEANGLLSRRRMQDQVDALTRMKILRVSPPVEKFTSFDFLPEALKPLTNQ